MWSVMRPAFDQGLVETYERDFASGNWTGNFIKAFRPMLILFMNDGDLEHMEHSVVVNGQDPDPTICRRVLSSSRIGATLFASIGMRLDYLVFQSTLKKRLDDLDFHDFQAPEVASFKQLMQPDIKALHDGGHSSWDKRTGIVDFLGAQMKMPMNSLHDDVDLRFMARLKAVALNTGAVPMLPWEQALWSPGGIPNTRAVCDIPASLLAEVLNVRDAARRLIGPDDTTFADMRRAVSPYIKTLLALDRSFILEFTFLSDHAAAIASEQTRVATLELLPTESKHSTFGQAI